MLAGWVTSYNDARRLAARAGQRLQIAAAAWRQVAAAGQAPPKPLKDARLT